MWLLDTMLGQPDGNVPKASRAPYENLSHNVCRVFSKAIIQSSEEYGPIPLVNILHNLPALYDSVILLLD